MQDGWNDMAAEWDNNDGVILYSQKAYQSLVQSAIVEGKRIMDFGCGTGRLTEQLSEQAKEVIALDPADKMIAVLERKQLPNVKTLAQTLSCELIDSHPFFQQKFDLIVASSALAFVPDFQETLETLAGLLNSQGKLVQWDWLNQEGESGVGFSQAQLEEAYSKIYHQTLRISEPFDIQRGAEVMPVIMAVMTR